MSDDDNREFSLTGEEPREARRVRVSAEDIEKARAILREFRDASRRAGRKDTVAEVEHVMRVLSGLYVEAK